MTERILNVQEVATMIGSSIQTVSSWYRWKHLNPSHELANLLPEYTRIGNRNTRYWKESDIWKLLEFKKSIPQGRYGVMGEITQKYVKKKVKDDTNESNS